MDHAKIAISTENTVTPSDITAILSEVESSVNLDIAGLM